MTISLRGRGATLGPGDEQIAFSFEGQALTGRRGESLAAALTAAGVRALRVTGQGEARGLFCGMGICQECLVEIDGRPNQRACMTKLEHPVSLRRQSHLAAVVESTALATPAEDMPVLEPDILVVGGGAGGLNAALSAARAGAHVLLVDERPLPGGQYYKQALDRPGSAAEIARDPQFRGGRTLIAATAAAGVTMLSQAQLWGAFEPLELMIFDGSVTRICRPKRLILATGAYERGLPLPGWTLPGVMTTGAAQTLLRSYGVLAGRRILIAGNGPLNFQVAVELSQAGAEVRAVVELAPPPGAWALGSLARMLATSPVLTLRGARYVAALRRAGVALRHGSVVAGVRPGDGGLVAEVTVWPIMGAETSERFEVDAVCLGYGFMPSNEIARALGCVHRFDHSRGQLVARRDAECRTSVPEIYVVGDCAGLGGAPAAAAEGVIAGLAAVRALGLTPDQTAQASERHARTALARHRRFQQGLWRLFAAPRLGLELADATTPVCRCEELTRAEIEAALAPAAPAIGTLKRRTRSGMGRCQGRYCGPMLAALAAEGRGEALAEEGHWAPRPPVKPIAIDDIAR